MDCVRYNDKTGQISANPDYRKAHALFQLPLDASKANPVKAAQFLLQYSRIDLIKPHNPETEVDFLTLVEKGQIIPESKKEVTYDSYGLLHYEYDGDSTAGREEDFFEEGQIGLSNYAIRIVDKDFTIRRVIRFSREADGTILGMVYELGSMK